MSLYERMYDATAEAEGYREIATAAEAIVDDVAQQFVLWYVGNAHEEGYQELTIEQLYEQFKQTL